jgi:diketogulonate reductase-like aldo/keto reductase/predicted dehydrogenase
VECAFIGAGAVAAKYAAGLEESPLTVSAVCDLNADRAERFAAEHHTNEYTDLDDLLAAERAPLIVNLTSHDAHASVTRRALRADRHVFTEKPLALDAATAADLVSLAEERGVGLGCAPISYTCDAQQHARRLLADGRMGRVRIGYAHAHVGRVIDWHENPASFLAVGPLYDGAVYPLTVLVSWFGPITRVRTADAIDALPDRESRTPERPVHIEASVEFETGLIVRLTASMYVPHRSQECNSLELHGDDGSLYLADSGTLTCERDPVSVAGVGRNYTIAPSPRPCRDRTHTAGPQRLARAIKRGRPPTADAWRGAHVVAVCNAIETVTENDGPQSVPTYGTTSPSLRGPPVRPALGRRYATPAGGALRLPPIGFGCSRYRDGTYVDRIDSIATALDAGYRLFDSAELYGNEARIGQLLASPGTPDRGSLFLLSKVWNTNHEHVAEACEGTLEELGIDALDSYLLHWPDAWAYQGPLRRLADRPSDEQEALAFPEALDGSRETVDVPLETTWRRLESVYERGLARTLGICNVSVAQLRSLLATATVPPAIVQVERHPYQPRSRLVEWCHERGIRVLAHSPLSAPGLLTEDVLSEIAANHSVSPAAIVLAWNVKRGVVPIPSSTRRDHIVANLAAAQVDLTDDELARIDALEPSRSNGDCHRCAD